jgi:ubiquinone biosynthesis protein
MLQDVRNAARLARAATVLAQHDVLWPRELQRPPRWLGLAGRVARALPSRAKRASKNKAPAERFAVALEWLGPPYIKFGQLLATRPDIVGRALASELAKLQDRLPPFSQAEARAAIEAELGAPVEALFATLGPPVAAASIAQVHRAKIASRLGHNRPVETQAALGTVAVKVLRPNVEAHFARDLASFFWAARQLERLSAPARRLAPVALVKTLADSVARELDLRLEGAAAAEMAENTKRDSDFRVPRVDWTRTGRRVLTMEWVDGISLGDRKALIDAGHDPARLATLVMQAFLTHALRDGFFHADMHPGNLFVDAEGKLVAVDYGIMGRLEPPTRRYLAEILYGFLSRDYRRIADIHFEAGYVPARHSHESFAQALRAIGEPIFGRSAGDISMARLLAQLFETTALFDMALRPELVLLQKTMVVVEGVARHLDPEHNLWQAARPVLEHWMAHELSPEARLQSAAESAASLGRVITGLPTFLRTLEGAAAAYAERGLKLDAETIERLGKAQAHQGWGERLALWAIATALILVALLLL